MKSLDEFLDVTPAGQAEADAPSVAEPQQGTGGPDEPAAEVVEVQAEAPAAEAPAAAGEEGDGAPPVPEDVSGLKSALQATRKERADHKGRADRLAGELAEVRAQLAGARQPPPVAPVSAPPPPPPPQVDDDPMPHPGEDPWGYAQWNARQIQTGLRTVLLHSSETTLRQAIRDDADVDEKILAFKEAARLDPAMRATLNAQRDPYRWAYDVGSKIIEARQMTTDPEAYRAKIAAEERAKVLAEMEAEAAASPSPGAPRVSLPPSLGTARSAAPRGVAVLTVDDSFKAVLERPRRGRTG